MNWASITLVVFVFLNLGIHLGLHGKTRVQKIDFWSALLSGAITMTLYYYAGVFN